MGDVGLPKVNEWIPFFSTHNASSAPVATTSLADGDFSKSETARATFPKGENKFFKAKIEE